MDFRYRAIDRKPTMMSYLLQSKTPYPSNRSQQGACGYSGYLTNTFRLPAAGDVQWREFEKEKIRREIIADEIEIERRKRQFEEDMRMRYTTL